MLAHICSGAAAQYRCARDFMRNDSLRAPVLAVWLASFGSSLHAPVTTFYYLEMGASYTDIGLYGMIVSMGAVLTAPLQGAYADSHSSSYPVLMGSVTACTIGCLIRGYGPTKGYILAGLAILSFFGGANLVAMTQAHIVKASPDALRGSYVSSLLVQLGVARITAKLLFPMVDASLRGMGFTDSLYRKRLHMTSCIIFCVIGMAVVYTSRHTLRHSRAYHPLGAPTAGGGQAEQDDAGVTQTPPTSPPAASAVSSTPSPTLDPEGGPGGGGVRVAVPPPLQPPSPPLPPLSEPGGIGAMQPIVGQEEGAPPPLPPGSPSSPLRTNRGGLFASNVALHAQSVAASALFILWPLFLRDHFAWGAMEYSYVLFGSAVLTTASVGSAPALERLGGHLVAVSALCVAAAVGSAVALAAPVLLPGGGGAVVALHVVGYAVATSAVAALDPIIKVGASFHSTQGAQARAFGGLATSAELGAMLGSYVATWLYQMRAGTPASGVYPAALVATAMCAIVLPLWVARVTGVTAALEVAAPESESEMHPAV